MEEWLDYEAMTFALGGDVACPECGMGILLPICSEEAQRLVCDVCDEVFEVTEDDE